MIGTGTGLRQRLAATGAAVMMIALLAFAGLFDGLDERLATARAALTERDPSGSIVVVEIDAKSIAELQNWPWPRAHHAAALRAMKAAGADMVGFDVDFSALSDPRHDRAFAAAIRESGPVVLPIFQQQQSSVTRSATRVVSRPAPVFAEAWQGGVNIFPSADGVVREYPAATVIDGQIHPSIAALLADSHAMQDRAFQPDWAIAFRRIPRLSFVDVMKGRVPADRIQGKRLLVGATAIELGDHHPVPRYGNIPGVFIQALAAESLIQGRAMTRTGPMVTVLALLAVWLAFALPRFARFGPGMAAAAVASLAVLAGGPLWVQANHPLTMDMAAPILAVLACVAVRVAIEVRRRIAQRAVTDPETGLPNRLAFDQAVAACTDPDRPLVVAGIERFDLIREAIGSSTAGDLLRTIAARIERSGAATVHRIDGDVLAWIGEPGADDQAIASLFRDPVQTAGGPIDVVATLGIAAIGGGAALSVERALAAMSGARATGEGCGRYRAPDVAARRHLSLIGELRKGLKRGEVTNVYQPKLDLRTRRIVSAETLVRWTHPDHGAVPPDEFIPLAEASGAIGEVTAHVLGTAIHDSAAIAAGEPFGIAVNVSAAEIAEPGFLEGVDALLAGAGGDRVQLTLEVTESAILRSPDRAIAALHALRQRGVRLSIDDYGTGQSTLTYLRTLPVHELKIDRSFVSALAANEADRIMVQSTIAMAHDLGLQVVAEGVEDDETIAILAAMGCDYAQGYRISRPLPLSGLLEILQRDPERRAA